MSLARRELEPNTSLWLCWRGLRQLARDSQATVTHHPVRGATETTPNATKNVTGRKIGLNLLYTSLVIYNNSLLLYISYVAAWRCILKGARCSQRYESLWLPPTLLFYILSDLPTNNTLSMHSPVTHSPSAKIISLLLLGSIWEEKRKEVVLSHPKAL